MRPLGQVWRPWRCAATCRNAILRRAGVGRRGRTHLPLVTGRRKKEFFANKPHNVFKYSNLEFPGPRMHHAGGGTGCRIQRLSQGTPTSSHAVSKPRLVRCEPPPCTARKSRGSGSRGSLVDGARCAPRNVTRQEGGGVRSRALQAWHCAIVLFSRALPRAVSQASQGCDAA